MAKRFFDISTLPKAFRKLSPTLKWSFIWLWNNCDAIGFWEYDVDFFEFENPGIDYGSIDFDFLEKEGYIILGNEGILINEFISVNYGTLKPDYNPHKPAFKSLEKNNFLILNPSLTQACFKLIDKDKDKDKEEDKDKGGVGENFEPQRKPFLEGDPTHMGFKGKCRIWLEQEKNYIWGKVDDHPIQSLEYKIKEVHRRGAMRVDKEALFETFQVIIEKLPDWIRENKFSLDYIDKKFNEIIHAINNKPAGKKGSAPISEQDEARLREMLESGALLGVD